MKSSPKHFINSCTTGNLETAKYILQQNPQYNFYNEYQCAFNKSCKYGHFDIAQWLLTVGSNVIDLSFEEYECFKCACRNGHLDVAQWLYNMIAPNCDKYKVCKDAFVDSCGCGYLDVAQWLYFMFNSPFNWAISAMDVFKYLGRPGPLHTADWLCNLMPFKYKTVNKDYMFMKTYICEFTDNASELLQLIYLFKKRNYIKYLMADLVHKFATILSPRYANCFGIMYKVSYITLRY